MTDQPYIAYPKNITEPYRHVPPANFQQGSPPFVNQSFDRFNGAPRTLRPYRYLSQPFENTARQYRPRPPPQPTNFPLVGSSTFRPSYRELQPPPRLTFETFHSNSMLKSATSASTTLPNQFKTNNTNDASLSSNSADSQAMNQSTVNDPQDSTSLQPVNVQNVYVNGRLVRRTEW